MTALAGTLHDPEGRLLPALRERAPLLEAYAGVYLAATAVTAPRLLALLVERGASLVAGGEKIGVARRTALDAAVTAGGGDAGDVLVCDFDRWLHWAGRFPDELAAVPIRLAGRRSAPWYACLGRTARAFATHPPVQRAAERATNHALSLAVGRRLDATAGAAWLSRDGAALILQESTEPTNATDLEWPALIHRAAPRRLAGVALDGLEFETAAFFPDEVAAAGGADAWVRDRYERPEVWLARLRLATDSVAALCRVLDVAGDQIG